MREPEMKLNDARQRAKAVRYARATCALEGISESPRLRDQARRFVAGEISAADAVNETRAFYGLPD
jgi:hypothetical protein